jgi:hypothetical protein
MCEPLVTRLRRAHEFIRALWIGDPPDKDSACELCAEAATELERLTEDVERLRSLIRKLRNAWFDSKLRYKTPEREWEDEREASRRMMQNNHNLIQFNDQTERIIRGEDLNLTPYCMADLDTGKGA